MGRRQKTPGPGAYDVPKHLVIGSPDPRLSSNFASKVPRTLHHTDHFGDPGQYDLQKAAPSLGKNEPIGQSIGSSFNVTVKSGRASFNTRGTGRARSAPPRNQRGGPGEHDFDHLYRVGATATSPGGRSPSPSSSFRSKTPLGGHVRKSDTPGVGRYDPKPQYAVGGGATSGGNEPGKKSAVFASTTKSARSSPARSTSGPNVGPGTYNAEKDTTVSGEAARKVNPRLPGFSSSASRGGVVGGVTTEGKSKPGPGTYSADGSGLIDETVGARSHRSFNEGAQKGASSFNTRQGRVVRQPLKATAAVDYTIDHGGVNLGKSEPLAHAARRSFNVGVKEGRASFDSRVKRPHSAPTASARGGPGEQDFSHLYRIGATAASKGPSSSFRSKTPLGGHVRKSDTPGVGRYDPKPQYAVGGGATSGGNEPGKKSAVFASTTASARTSPARSTSGPNVGPGTYDAAAHTLQRELEKKRNPRLPGFGSSAARDPDDD